MKRFRTLLSALVVMVLLSSTVTAQTIVNLAQARLEFTSVDHDSIVPVGVTGEGGPVLVSYRAIVLLTANDPVTGVTTLFGSIVPKASATVITGVTPNQTFSLTFAQLGITPATLPVCTAVAPALCPAYSIVLTANGPGGPTARLASATSDSFSLAAQILPARPASPSTVKVKGS